MSRRLHVKLRGGLGNQLHIFIASWVVGKFLGKSLKLDGRFISWTGSNPNRRIEIHKFILPSVNDTENQILERFPSFTRFPKFRFAILRVVNALNSRKSAAEHPGDSWINFDRIIKFCNDKSRVEGHFLDLHWVMKAFEMGFPASLELQTGSVETIFPGTLRHKQCAIHVRLTDYLSHNHVFTQLSEDYYLNAIMLFRQKGLNEFLLFSDDVEALKVHFPRLTKAANIKIVPSHLSTAESFYLMHQCFAIISANSTFSTLAAMFIWRRGGEVVSPSKRKIEESRLGEYWVPPEWIILDSHSGKAVN